METNDQLISVHYDGEGERIQSHQMKASHVSISLEGLEVIYSEAFKEASRVYNSKVTTEVVLEGGFQQGSIEWLMKIFISDPNPQQPLLGTSVCSSVMNAVSSVINLLKNMDLSVTEIVIHERSGAYEIDIDGERVILSEIQHALLTNPSVRKAISNIATPLTGDGVDNVTIDQKEPSCPAITIRKSEKDNLIINRAHKYITDEGDFAGYYFIDTLSYNPKSKWKIINKDDSSESIKALITDPKFLRRVSDNEEKFSKDDLLQVEGSWYKEKTSFTGKVRMNYTVTKVVNHIPAEDKQWMLI